MRFFLKYRFALIVGAAITCCPSFAMDCTLARDASHDTWKASCGVKRFQSRWTGFIQGPLLGSKLSFSNSQRKKVIEGGILAPLSLLSEIPSCHLASSATNETCKLISKKISLSLPFELTDYSQDPIAFTINTEDGSELKIAACGVGPDKKTDETAELLRFKRNMDCTWSAPLTHPIAINCKSPNGDGILQVNSGNIRCELRQKKSQEKAIVTDVIPVVCLNAIDPISCLGDDRVGFTTQAELRGKIKAPQPTKTLPSAKGAAGINGT